MTDPVTAIRRKWAKAPAGPWVLWTSCSWRRIKTRHGDRVLEPVVHNDGHPDLCAWEGTDKEEALQVIADAPTDIKILIAEVAYHRERETVFRQALSLAGHPVTDKGAYRADVVSAVKSLIQDRDHWRNAAVYLADCNAATLAGLPKRHPKSRRERLAQLCRKSAAFLDGDFSVRPSNLEAVKVRLTRALEGAQ